MKPEEGDGTPPPKGPPEKKRRTRWGQTPSDVADSGAVHAALGAAAVRDAGAAIGGVATPAVAPPSSSAAAAAAATAAAASALHAKAEAARAALARVGLGSGPQRPTGFTTQLPTTGTLPTVTGTTAGISGIVTPAAPGVGIAPGETAAPGVGGLQQQMLLMQRLQPPTSRAQQLSSILESIRGRLPFGIGGEEIQFSRIPTRFDHLGRPLDEDGNVIPLVRPKHATLKINRNIEQQEQKQRQTGGPAGAGAKLKVSKSGLKAFSDPSQNPWFDPSLKGGGNKLKHQAFRFVESGFYVRQQLQLDSRAIRGGGEAASIANLPQLSDLATQAASADHVAKARVAAEGFIRRTQLGGASGAAGGRFGPSGFKRHAGDNLFGRTTQGLTAAAASAVGGVATSSGESEAAGETEAIATGATEDELTSVTAATPSRPLAPLLRKRQDAFPELEWWDVPLVMRLTPEELKIRSSKRQGSEFGGAGGTGAASGGKRKKRSGWSDILDEDDFGDNFPFRILDANINHLVEHPVPIEPIAQKDVASIAPQIFLIEKERKKMRRRARQEREQEKRDQIRMGLREPEPPKVKLSNLMRVLKDTSVADPTSVEAKVRAQVQERLAGHQRRNVAKRLSQETRSEKHRQRWAQKDETTVAVQSAVFVVKDITDKKLLYKVHKNAQQLQLTGAAVFCPGVGNLIVVEGGPRAIKKYKALMLRRIKWTAGENNRVGGVITGEEPEEEEIVGAGGEVETPGATIAATGSPDGYCQVLWQGTVKDRTFPKWLLATFQSASECEAFYAEHNASQYWSMLIRHRDAVLDVL